MPRARVEPMDPTLEHLLATGCVPWPPPATRAFFEIFEVAFPRDRADLSLLRELWAAHVAEVCAVAPRPWAAAVLAGRRPNEVTSCGRHRAERAAAIRADLADLAREEATALEAARACALTGVTRHAVEATAQIYAQRRRELQRELDEVSR